MFRFIIPNTQPVHEHDCERCVFHGTGTGDNGKIVDFYTCGDTVLARYGSDGPEYSSGDAEIYARDPPFFTSQGPIAARMVELAEKILTPPQRKAVAEWRQRVGLWNP